MLFKNLSIRLCILVLSGAPLTWVVHTAQALAIREEPLGSFPEKLSRGSSNPDIIVSQSGENVASVFREGAKERVASLTAIGEPYERILPRSLRWVNNRVVYVGEKDGKVFLIDGTITRSLPGPAVEKTAGDRPLVSLDGSKYVIFVASETGIAAWENGLPSDPEYDEILFVPQYQRANAELIYAASRNCEQRVQGNEPSSMASWTKLTGIFAGENATNVYAWGFYKGRPLLRKNGLEVFNGEISDTFRADREGENWAALLDRSSAATERTAFIVNGKFKGEVESSIVSSELYMAPSGLTWAWIIKNPDGSPGATLKLPNKEDVRLSWYNSDSLSLSEDGSRIAYVVEKDSKRNWVVDGATVPDEALHNWDSFRFGPGKAFAYVGTNRSGDTAWVTTEVGVGKPFSGVSEPRFNDEGKIVYAASREGDRFIAVGNEVSKVNADELIKSSLSVTGKEVRVLGMRGRAIIAFSVQLH